MKIVITKDEILETIKLQNKVLNLFCMVSTVEEITYYKVINNFTNDLSKINGVEYSITTDGIEINLPPEMLIDIMKMYGDIIPVVISTVKLLTTDINVKVKELESKWLKA